MCFGTYLTMTENRENGRVEVQDNQILFMDQENSKIYKTEIMNDPELVSRFHASGAQFTGEIVEEKAPFLSILLTWILPLAIFIGTRKEITVKK